MALPRAALGAMQKVCKKYVKVCNLNLNFPQRCRIAEEEEFELLQEILSDDEPRQKIKGKNGLASGKDKSYSKIFTLRYLHYT